MNVPVESQEGTYVLRVVAIAGMRYGDGDDPTGLLLSAYDPDGQEGRGTADFTGDPAKALRLGENV